MFWLIWLGFVTVWGILLVLSSFQDPQRVSPWTPLSSYQPMHSFAVGPAQVPMWRDAHGRLIPGASAPIHVYLLDAQSAPRVKANS